MFFKAFFLFLCIALTFFIFIPIEIEIKIIAKEQKNYSFIVIRLLNGIIKFRFNLSLVSGYNSDPKNFHFLSIRKTDSAIKKKASLEEIIRFSIQGIRIYQQNNVFYRHLFSKIKVKNFSVLLKLGVNDAAITAILSGGLTSLLSSVFIWLNNRYKLKESNIVIIPMFQCNCFDVDLNCIITLKIGNIIIAAIKQLLDRIKRW